jgi:DNA-binding Xre family transcriptional regulator
VRVVRWRIRELLAERKVSLYAFAKAMGYTNPSWVYQRFPENGEFHGDVNAKVLDRMCAVLGVGIGDVLEYIPEPPGRHRKR